MKLKPLILRYFTGIAILIFPLLASSCSTTLKNEYSSREQEKEAYALIQRTIGDRARQFDLRIGSPREDGRDWFSLYSGDGRIVLEGNNGVSVASAFKAYLERCCHCQITWCGVNLDLPDPLPLPDEKITEVSPYKYRYYLNYCTFNYTMSWWDAERWQREIDFMAMNGVNAPLAVTGQCSIWQRVYRRLGFTDEELSDFFCAPTHFSWFWMGNLDGWGGPLPQSFFRRHEDLQKFILEKERRLGMTPILPSFTGHVPPAFPARFPEAEVHQTRWVNFAPVNILAPDDSLFTVIGHLFMEEQTKAYGTNHLYSADTFNENRPPLSDSLYLNGMGRRVYESMSTFDPEAVWVMQGWLFYSEGDFWGEKETKALLSGVPDDRMLILDLWSDRVPLWRKTKGYYGKPWVWCMLHNFGQNPDFNGNLANVATGPSEALADPLGRNLSGIGVTMEGIEQMPSVYALMFDNFWRDTPQDTDEFMSRYLRNRYGRDYRLTEEAWAELDRSVFEYSISGGMISSTVTSRPFIGEQPWRLSERHTEKYVKPLGSAWRKMMEAALSSDDLCAHDGFRYDIVDITRQVLTEYADVIQAGAARAFAAGDAAGFETAAAAYLELLDDLDRLLETRREFLLGRWLAYARAYGDNAEEADLYEHNARDLITLWGDRDCGIHDYAYRHWAGLVGDFYRARWAELFSAAGRALKEGTPFDAGAFEEMIKDREWEWTLRTGSFATEPSGDEVAVCRELYEKYSGVILMP